MRVQVGNLALDLTDEQVESLRRQLGVPGNGDGLLDTAAAAKRLGTSTEYVREHAQQLGGRKLGSGPKARWRFDPAKLEQTPANLRPGSEAQAKSPKVASPKPRRRKIGDKDLLEIRGAGPYAS